MKQDDVIILAHKKGAGLSDERRERLCDCYPRKFFKNTSRLRKCPHPVKIILGWAAQSVYPAARTSANCKACKGDKYWQLLKKDCTADKSSWTVCAKRC
jgi:hypothetical protein